MSPETVSMLLNVLEVVMVFLGGFWAYRKFVVERVGVLAEANQDNVTATATWVETYDKLFTMMQDRDAEILELRRQIGEQSVRIDMLEHKLDQREGQLTDCRKDLEEAQQRIEILLVQQCPLDECPTGHRKSVIKPQEEEING